MSENNKPKWPPEGVDKGTVKRIIGKFEDPGVDELDQEMKRRVEQATARLVRLERLRKSYPKMADLIERL